MPNATRPRHWERDSTRVAVCKIDSSKVCPIIANNKITGILKFNNFSSEEDGVRVWQAYGIGEGVYFDEFEAKQDVSGLETQTIKGFFSRLAAEQRGQVVEEEFFDTDGQESRALEQEALLQELVDETQREIDLQHPITFKNFNLCLLLSKRRLSDALKKLKLCDLREIQEGLNVEINGPSSRKATCIELLVNLVRSCSCCH